MNKKTIVIIILFVIVGGLGGYLFFKNNQTEPSAEEEFGGGEFPNVDSTVDISERQIEFLNNEGQTFDLTTSGTSLLRITNIPVAGVVSFEEIVGTSTSPVEKVRFVERGTGHIYEVVVDEGSKIERISNTTIPRTTEAVWSPSGERVLIRYEDESGEVVKNFLARVGEEQKEGVELDGDFLPESLFSPVFSPEGTLLFYLTPQPSPRGSSGILYSINSGNSEEIFSSPIKEWVTDWTTENNITLTTKPSGSAKGYSYSLSTSSGVMQKIIGNFNGLTLKENPSGTTAFFAASSQNSFHSFTNLDGVVENAAVNTLPEKCVWSKMNTEVIFCAVPETIAAGLYPEKWYLGDFSFEDSIWKINVSTGEIEIVSVLSEDAGLAIDVTNLVLSPNEDSLYFINKKDLGLWRLNLSSENPEVSE